VVCWGGSRFGAQGIYLYSTSVFDITGTNYIETVISCTWGEILLNEQNERGHRTRVTGCYTVQRSHHPFKVELTSLSNLINVHMYGSDVMKDMLNVRK
jgi:hypothetical protein